MVLNKFTYAEGLLNNNARYFTVIRSDARPYLHAFFFVKGTPIVGGCPFRTSEFRRPFVNSDGFRHKRRGSSAVQSHISMVTTLVW